MTMIRRRGSISGPELRRMRAVGIAPGTTMVSLGQHLGDPDNAAYEDVPCPPDPIYAYNTPYGVPFSHGAYAPAASATAPAAAGGTVYEPYGTDATMKGARRGVACASCTPPNLGDTTSPFGLGWGTFFGVLGAAAAAGAAFELFRKH